jgi:N-acetylmuramoyl-L-alanine amidase
VIQGETLPAIADRYGFADYRFVYDAPDNAELKQRRPDPNLLEPGDVVVIPEAQPKQESGATGRANAFRANVRPLVVRLVLKDHAHAPIAGAAWELVFEGGRDVATGTTDGGGKLEAPVPSRATRATLTVQGRTYTLLLGHLDPLRGTRDRGVAGVQGRLRNLGYYAAPVDGVLGPATRIAIGLFQHDHGVTPDGEPTDATLQKLEEVHGS